MKLRTILLAAVASLLTAIVVSQAQVPGVNSTLNSVFTLAYDNSTMKPTYATFVSGASPVASAADVCTLSGSATKTIKVRRIFFSNLATTAVSEPVSIIKRSTINTTGGGSTLVPISYDSSNTASTVAFAEVWSTNPTLGTAVGVLADIVLPFSGLSAVQAPYIFNFGALGQPIVLRGAAQSVNVSLNAITFGGTIGCGFEWTEE